MLECEAAVQGHKSSRGLDNSISSCQLPHMVTNGGLCWLSFLGGWRSLLGISNFLSAACDSSCRLKAWHVVHSRSSPMPVHIESMHEAGEILVRETKIRLTEDFDHTGLTCELQGLRRVLTLQVVATGAARGIRN
ncbi:hypothetical protein Tco_0558808 [Tanacetum coccineum]